MWLLAASDSIVFLFSCSFPSRSSRLPRGIPWMVTSFGGCRSVTSAGTPLSIFVFQMRLLTRFRRKLPRADQIGSPQALAAEEEGEMSVLNLEAEALDVAKMMEAEAVVAVEGVELAAKVVIKVVAVAVAEAGNHMGECRFFKACSCVA
ncbi:hypothetical protein BAE44_0015900 [Dichanthelium oligosanthes]|uniref:Uncharacterized protein n=1 Tax=Dichanthelium oligosanthes TaxID=888268 RepID=A0A1E5VD55_9POAL|nr:hypothetical protein BAE44_0015900 [Dichanthelium oligosanthes]